MPSDCFGGEGAGGYRTPEKYQGIIGSAHFAALIAKANAARKLYPLGFPRTCHACGQIYNSLSQQQKHVCSVGPGNA
jgi:hypothetical protein